MVGSSIGAEEGATAGSHVGGSDSGTSDGSSVTGAVDGTMVGATRVSRSSIGPSVTGEVDGATVVANAEGASSGHRNLRNGIQHKRGPKKDHSKASATGKEPNQSNKMNWECFMVVIAKQRTIRKDLGMGICCRYREDLVDVQTSKNNDRGH